MNKKEIVTFGEILLRLKSPGNNLLSQANQLEMSFGGAEANVAVSLASLGLKANFITRIPSNELGEMVLGLLRKYNVGTRNILMGGNRLGLYFLETGALLRPSKIIYDRAFSSFSEIQPGMINWKDVLREARWFHWSGISPALSSSSAQICNEALDVCKKKGITVSCDLNFRKNLWKYGRKPSDIMDELVQKCDLLVGNEEDVQNVLNIFPLKQKNNIKEKKYSDFISISKQLFSKFPRLQHIGFSIRNSISADWNKWSGLLFDKKEIFRSNEYDLTDIVDRVGSGDAFMAGIIYGMVNFPENKQRIIDFAVAASCLKHSINGDFNLARVDEVENIIKGNTSGRINR